MFGMSSKASPDILCIGAVLWDIIGRSDRAMVAGNDVPGRILRLPGGVALNIALALRRLGLRPALLGALGCDTEGRDLIRACTDLGLICDHIHRQPALPTDTYMAIEGANGLIAAIADAHSLEAAGDAILAPLSDGRLGSHDAPWAGPVALDGNLTAALLAEIAASTLFRAADLRLAPASPGKAKRLRPFLTHPRAVLYVNREEAAILAERAFTDAADAAQGMVDAGAARVLVTDGSVAAAEGTSAGVLRLPVPSVNARRVTGAGDTFMAAHIVADLNGASPIVALERAVATAARYVAGEEITP
jgi:pseudouridine kinase